MIRSSILGASTMLNVLIQHRPLQSLYWTKIWKAFRASDPSRNDIVHPVHACRRIERDEGGGGTETTMWNSTLRLPQGRGVQATAGEGH